ncbi:thioredoxin family protein [Leptolyngbya ohadii]|uniref:thioredoxin family protein n=1 Tax=Leptolyngbya ohadii TaxID=1962290 RepID=UPI000B59CB32|nr:thioredoxin family protein [Leptolyngbya ohadii]
MITAQSFGFKDLIASSNLPLLVVFFSPLCGPSHLMDTVLQEVAQRTVDRLQIVKIDSEAYPSLASQYQVHALPTLLLFQHGELVARLEDERTENLMPADRLMQLLKPHL